MRLFTQLRGAGNGQCRGLADGIWTNPCVCNGFEREWELVFVLFIWYRLDQVLSG
jgi:hypothetical protein